MQLSTHERDAVWGAIQCDPAYSTLQWLTFRWWSDCLLLVPRITWHYWDAWDELSIEASILLKGDHVYIPPELLDRTLADLHSTHQGIEKMQALAREAVYQPGIDADIPDYVKRCAICTQYKASHLLSQCSPGISQQPMAGNSSRLLPSQRQRLPAHCQLIQQVPLPIPHLIEVSLVPCPKTQWHHSPIWPPVSYTLTMDPLYSRKNWKVPAEVVHQSHHLIPLLPSFKWFHRLTGEDAEDCTQHCPGCQNIP